MLRHATVIELEQGPVHAKAIVAAPDAGTDPTTQFSVVDRVGRDYVATAQHGIANLCAPHEPALVIFTGFVVAFVAGMFAIRFFMRYVNDHKLTPFAIYCWLFGLGSLAILLARGHGA